VVLPLKINETILFNYLTKNKKQKNKSKTKNKKTNQKQKTNQNTK
jgi:hypothetical protein